MNDSSRVRAARPGACVLALLATAAFAQRVPPLPHEVQKPATAPRSIVLDKVRADEIERANMPRFTDRVEVFGRDDDARPVTRKSAEQRFADVLNAPRGNELLDGLFKLDTRPCPSLASAVNQFGAAYNPYRFCP